MAYQNIPMRMIHRNELPIGQPLPGNLYDHRKNKLLSRGQVLSKDTFQRLAQHIFYTGPDWPESGAPPAEDKPELIIQALADQHDETGDSHEKRLHQRHKWNIELSLTIRERDRSSLDNRQISVVTQDLSAGGFSFFHNNYLHLGSVVMARFDVLPHRPKLAGDVRSCTLLEGTRHRIGVQFTTNKPPF